jgi:hypothetical protein
MNAEELWETTMDPARRTLRQVNIEDAQESAALLPNALGVTDLYDFLLLLIRLFVRWFVFPALVFAWLYTGLQFVFAQGNPGKIKEARTWLLWVFIATFIIMLSEAFAFALRATINQIF